MKTFDIAKEYLKDVDLVKWDLFSDEETKDRELVRMQVKTMSKAFLKDKRLMPNTDEYYRLMTFEACVHHMAELAQPDVLKSYFDVACSIIEANKDILKTKFEGYGGEGSAYPQVMIDEFIKYCNELNPQPRFLGDRSEVRIEFFMIAFHYKIDAVS